MKTRIGTLVAVVALSWVPRSAQAACFPAWTDSDGDTYCTNTTIARDCDDGDDTISPDDQEVLGNQVDEDCDGHDALNRKLLTTSFPPLSWVATGTVTRPGTNDWVKLGNGTNGGSVVRTLNQTIANGKFWLVADVNAFTVGGFGSRCTIAVTTKPWPSGSTTTVTSNVFSSGTKILGPLSVDAPARILTEIEMDCPAGPTMTVDWL